MFSAESLGKIKVRAFAKHVVSLARILSPKSIDYFGTSEQYWVVEKIRILISKTEMVGCCKLLLYANGLVMSIQFIFGDNWNDWSCKSLFWSLAMMLFLWNRGPWIFVYLYTRIAWDRRRYFRSSLTRVLNEFRNKLPPKKKEYVDKVGSKSL